MLDITIVCSVIADIEKKGNGWILITDIPHRRNYNSENWSIDLEHQEIRYMILVHKDNGRRMFIPWERIQAIEEKTNG